MTATQTFEITNLNQIVTLAKHAVDVATDKLDTYGKMETLRNTALFLLTEKLGRLGWEEDKTALLDAFQFVYNENCSGEDVDAAEEMLMAGLSAFQDHTGNQLLLNLLFWCHFITETQEQMATTLRAAKDQGVDGAHKMFQLLRLEGNAVVRQLNAFQDRLLAD